jgi:hypothetical protein
MRFFSLYIHYPTTNKQYYKLRYLGKKKTMLSRVFKHTQQPSELAKKIIFAIQFFLKFYKTFVN